MSYTKGKWYRNGLHIGVVTEGNGVLHIAETKDITILKEEAEANARLIASAPDLLEACESAMFFLIGIKAGYETQGLRTDTIEKHIKQIYQAIDQAKGENDAK